MDRQIGFRVCTKEFGICCPDGNTARKTRESLKASKRRGKLPGTAIGCAKRRSGDHGSGLPEAAEKALQERSK